MALSCKLHISTLYLIAEINNHLIERSYILLQKKVHCLVLATFSRFSLLHTYYSQMHMHVLRAALLKKQQ